MSTEAGRGLAERATMGPSSTASVAAATLVGWAALAVLVLLSYASASAWPPPGRFFSGAFAFQDDFYQYLGFHLKQECRPGNVLLAPMDPGLIVAGLAPCLVVLGHRVLTPGFASRVEEVRRFYTRETSPLWRRGYLEPWDRMEPVPSDGP
jgi:hypothetical protein